MTNNKDKKQAAQPIPFMAFGCFCVIALIGLAAVAVIAFTYWRIAFGECVV